MRSLVAVLDVIAWVAAELFRFSRMANFNHAKFVGRAIAFALAQGNDVLEIIVIDDASTDDGNSTIEAALHGHPQARLLRNETNRVVAVDLLDNKLDMTRQRGATHCLNASHVDTAFRSLSETGDGQVHHGGEALIVPGPFRSHLPRSHLPTHMG